MPRTEGEVRGVLISHQQNGLELADPEFLKKVAKRMKRSEEYVKGYHAGVEFAYKWFLQSSRT